MPKKHYVPARELFDQVSQLLEQGYEADITVTGNSMWPLLAHGRDRVVLRKQPPKNGDIVLFCPVEGKYLLHRINRLKNGRFRTAGDGNCFHDGSFPVSCIVGTAVAIVRKGKRKEANSLGLRLWSSLWRRLFPARKLLLRLLRALAAVRRKAA